MLQGLLALAHSHYRQLIHCEKAIADLLREEHSETDCGHISDDIWSGKYDTSDLLKRLGIEVIK